MAKKIVILAAGSQDELENKGAAVAEDASDLTLKAAKARAKYYLTEEYRHVIEASERLGYSQVLVNGECVADYEETDTTSVKCSWFANCTNNAVTTKNHTTLGDVPICKRCADKTARIEAQTQRG
jgi:hypothetical protein